MSYRTYLSEKATLRLMRTYLNYRVLGTSTAAIFISFLRRASAVLVILNDENKHRTYASHC